jgi:hypothetical protein
MYDRFMNATGSSGELRLQPRANEFSHPRDGSYQADDVTAPFRGFVAVVTLLLTLMAT